MYLHHLLVAIMCFVNCAVILCVANKAYKDTHILEVTDILLIGDNSNLVFLICV